MRYVDTVTGKPSMAVLCAQSTTVTATMPTSASRLMQCSTRCSHMMPAFWLVSIADEKNISDVDRTASMVTQVAMVVRSVSQSASLMPPSSHSLLCTWPYSRRVVMRSEHMSATRIVRIAVVKRTVRMALRRSLVSHGMHSAHGSNMRLHMLQQQDACGTRVTTRCVCIAYCWMQRAAVRMKQKRV